MIIPTIQQVALENDGVWTVYVAIEIEEKLSGRFTVQATTPQELKDAIRPYLVKAMALDADTNTRKAQAQAVLDELKTELGIP